MKKSISSVVKAIIKKDGKYLLTKRCDVDNSDPKHHDFWHIPGGVLEFKEDTQDAVIREMREELGVEIEVLRLVPKIFNFIGKHSHGVFIHYICKLKDTEAPIVLNEEASAYGWFTAVEIKDLIRFSDTDEVIAFVEATICE